MTDPRVKIGGSRQTNPEHAVHELADQLNQPDIGLVIIFISSHFDPALIEAALNNYFGHATVIGCTTAGEIGSAGYHDGSLSGLSIHRDDINYEVAVMEHLSTIDSHDCLMFAHKLKEALQLRAAEARADNTFALMLIDGLCTREEMVSRAFYDGLGGLPLVGGSAGDDQAFRQTRVLCKGRFVSDAAVLVVATTPFLFEVFKTQHFVSGSERLIVTAALPERRIVTEINGCPAAEEYARTVGMAVAQLNSQVFATHPVIVRVGNTDFVRAIQKMNPDGSLTFFCAIDEGIVFKMAKAVSMTDNLEITLDNLQQRIGQPALILCFDCILRLIEATQLGLCNQIGSLLADSNAVGFSTYGEQYGGMHINQTFTGVAIGKGRRA